MSIKARVIIEIVGGPKEHVDKAMGTVMEKIKSDKNIELLKEKVFEAKPIEGKPFFTTFSEMDIGVKEMGDLFGFCFDFMPSSVEIFDPPELKLKVDSVNDMFNELMAKLHQYDMTLKNVYAENVLLKRKYGLTEDPNKKEEKK